MMDASSKSGSLSSRHALPNVPEEKEPSPSPTATKASSLSSGPYMSNSAANSSSTVNSLGNAQVPSSKSNRKTSNGRTLGRVSNDHLSASAAASSSSSSTVKRSTSTSSGITGNKDSRSRSTAVHSSNNAHAHEKKTSPRLPHDKDVDLAPSTIMYWSKAPVWGTVPTRMLRAHTATLLDTTIWIFGGCDDKESSKDVFCFDIESMQWSRPDIVGDIPPPCRAHTATIFERKIITFGGGLRSTYYDSVYTFDTMTRRWSRPHIAPGPRPVPRRAHTAVMYQGKIYIFGGGTGLTALNDLWSLDVSNGAGSSKEKPMKWEQLLPADKKPGPRGYHTANLVGNIMVVIGGSDGKETFTDVWCLNLDTLVWTLIQPQPHALHKRLAHTSTQVGSYIFIMGGHNATEYTSDILTFNLVSLQYEPRFISGKPPAPRGYHATVLADSRLLVFGGSNEHSSYDDVHILDLAAGAYLPQVTSFSMDASM